MKELKSKQCQDELLRIQIDSDSFLILSSAWGSRNAQHRELIHQERTHHPLLKSSVSHCSDFGGILFSKKNCGFDLELDRRVSLPVVERVSSVGEIPQLLQHRLSPSFLWTAKEASWKTTREFEQPAVISNMQVTFIPECGRLVLSTQFNAQDFHFFCAHIGCMKNTEHSPDQKPQVADYYGVCWQMKLIETLPEFTLSVCFR